MQLQTSLWSVHTALLYLSVAEEWLEYLLTHLWEFLISALRHEVNCCSTQGAPDTIFYIIEQNFMYKMWNVCAPLLVILCPSAHPNKTKPQLKKKCQPGLELAFMNWLENQLKLSIITESRGCNNFVLVLSTLLHTPSFCVWHARDFGYKCLRPLQCYKVSFG